MDNQDNALQKNSKHFFRSYMVVNVLENTRYVLNKFFKIYFKVSIAKKYIKLFRQQNQDVTCEEIGEDIYFFINKEKKNGHKKNNIKDVI